MKWDSIEMKVESDLRQLHAECQSKDVVIIVGQTYHTHLGIGWLVYGRVGKEFTAHFANEGSIIKCYFKIRKTLKELS